MLHLDDCTYTHNFEYAITIGDFVTHKKEIIFLTTCILYLYVRKSNDKTFCSKNDFTSIIVQNTLCKKEKNIIIAIKFY